MKLDTSADVYRFITSIDTFAATDVDLACQRIARAMRIAEAWDAAHARVDEDGGVDVNDVIDAVAAAAERTP